jgi:hypothetical protein
MPTIMAIKTINNPHSVRSLLLLFCGAAVTAKAGWADNKKAVVADKTRNLISIIVSRIFVEYPTKLDMSKLKCHIFNGMTRLFASTVSA